MKATDLLKELERDFHLQLSGSRLKDIADKLEFWKDKHVTAAVADAAIQSRPAIPVELPNGQGPVLVKESGLPTAADLDAVAKEQEIAHATE